MLRVLAIAFSIVAVAGNALAQPYVRFSATPDGTSSCNILLPASQQSPVYVIAQAKGFSGRIVVTGCGAVTIDAITLLVPGTVEGDLLSVIGGRVMFDECVTSSTAVLRIDVTQTGPSPPGCCRLGIRDGVITSFFPLGIYRCDGSFIQPQCFADAYLADGPGDCGNLVAYNPFPPDGATNVPLDVELQWQGDHTILNCPCVLGDDHYRVYFGRSLPLTFRGIWWDLPWDPGNLAPGTTYYWRIDRYTYGEFITQGELWSFTTVGQPVATENRTWGAVKALYR